MVKIDPAQVAFLGALLSLIGAAWALLVFARRGDSYGPPFTLAVAAMLLLGGNLYDEEPLSILDEVSFVALALGIAVSVYTVARRTRGRPSR